ncbi:fumarylacetoacetate hydrolase family protein [Halomonas dongshanensis]|uniref:Fumarylacetoacetate hydrolase family protein n=1 Tax=Halomonas dongshanensis TaxID=2890835 RepID=A0ABT2E995_9GAMM|nr:fumarylacetoacetate hydrolase family protein [Halomonas dongshanensis]MCS2608144.1 fumarylacetoacetate hydrolase family protein [Halomonas dongshanensis]
MVKYDKKELVATLVNAWKGNGLVNAELASDLSPGSLLEAYEIQKLLGIQMEWWPNGRPSAWKLVGERELAAPVPDRFIIPSPSVIKKNSLFSLCGIEVEIIVRLSRELLGGCSDRDVRNSIDGVFSAIEIFDVRVEDWRNVPDNFLLADLQMHGKLVLGDGVLNEWNKSLYGTELDILVNGLSLDKGLFRHPMGDPLAMIPWLASHAEKRGWPLQKGDMIATGSWSKMFEINPGDVVQAFFKDIGGVSVFLE